MKTGAVVAIVAGVLIVLYFAFSRGLIGSGGVGVRASGGVIAPQPSQNYSGYLAATTAPQVSGILNTVLSGVNSGLHSWLSPSEGTTVTQQGASPNPPSFAAQPSLSVPSSYVAPTSLVGPQNITDPVSYASTSGAAFGWSDLAAQNAYDSEPSLELPQGA